MANSSHQKRPFLDNVQYLWLWWCDLWKQATWRLSLAGSYPTQVTILVTHPSYKERVIFIIIIALLLLIIYHKGCKSTGELLNICTPSYINVSVTNLMTGFGERFVNLKLVYAEHLSLGKPVAISETGSVFLRHETLLLFLFK